MTSPRFGYLGNNFGAASMICIPPLSHGRVPTYPMIGLNCVKFSVLLASEVDVGKNRLVLTALSIHTTWSFGTPRISCKYSTCSRLQASATCDFETMFWNI